MTALGLDRASFNQGKGAKYDFSIYEEQQPTLTARGPGAVTTDGGRSVRSGPQGSRQSVCKSRQVNFAGGVQAVAMCL